MPALAPREGAARAGLAAALAALLLSTTPGLAADGKAFRDWQAECQPDAGCLAETGGPSTRLGLDRADGADGFYIRLDFSDPLPDPDRPLTLLVDGEKTVLAAHTGWVLTGAEGRSFVSADAPLRARLTEAMLKGSQLVLEYIDVTGEPRRQLFSLSGLSAALLWIEERMGIVGAERRAIVPDELAQARPEATSKKAKEASIEASGVPEAVRGLHIASSACEAPDTELMKDIPVQIAKVSETAIVYAIPCTVGAYNITYRLYLRETGEIGGARTLYFPEWSKAYGWSGTDLLFNVSLEGTHLSAFAKGRGLGDCGSSAEFTFLDYAYRLDRYIAEEDCNGRLPDAWPVIYEHKS
ncbi:DUF1176 domain-containing protein [Afifella sp. IM 167]|uniref:DUF1176 domain-containing protein n=1 Tax=Afifella sp. IM 167 TaxID=2033586 RepID=UPI001CCBA877|nr:DUF1176 domain-containing protein [Afifella sp. IM 167]